MSEKELNRFLADLESNASLHEAVQALRPASDSGNCVPAEALLAIAKQHGYRLEMEDFNASVGELDESELEAVVGGATSLAGRTVLPASPIDANHGKWIDILSFKFF